MKKILLPVVLILQLCMPVQKLILHTFFNARVPLGLCQINISVWAWHEESFLYPIGGGEYLNLWAWRVDCEQCLIFLLSHGDLEHVWGASGTATPITPPFLPLICIVSLFRLPRGNEERRTTARGLPKEWPTSIFMLNKIDIIIIKGKVREN